MSIEFGILLRKYREEQKLSQEKLLAKLDAVGCEIWNKSTISKWENGKNRPALPVIVIKLEDILNLKRGLLLRPAGYYCEDSQANQLDTDEDREARLTSEQSIAPNLCHAEYKRRPLNDLCRLLKELKEQVTELHKRRPAGILADSFLGVSHPSGI